MKITVAYLRDLEKQVSLGEISYSRMVELLNEKAGGGSSPVSQQLTRERLKTLLVDLVDRVTGADELTVMDIQDIDSTVNDICQLSVSPDAQKEIEELKEYAKTITHQYDVLKKITEKFKAQLTSKESDVKRAVEALEKIRSMKKLHEKESYEYVFNRCWHIVDKALKGNKTEQPLHSICKCKEQKQVSYNECCGDSCINIKNIEQ